MDIRKFEMQTVPFQCHDGFLRVDNLSVFTMVNGTKLPYG